VNGYTRNTISLTEKPGRKEYGTTHRDGLAWDDVGLQGHVVIAADLAKMGGDAFKGFCWIVFSDLAKDPMVFFGRADGDELHANGCYVLSETWVSKEENFMAASKHFSPYGDKWEYIAMTSCACN
jgi:hypothetical protein